MMMCYDGMISDAEADDIHTEAMRLEVTRMMLLHGQHRLLAVMMYEFSNKYSHCGSQCREDLAAVCLL